MHNELMTPAPQSGFAPWNDPAQTPLVSFRSVTRTFGDFTAVDNLSLNIYEREFFALLGPSGCGKTTLMRMLAGFEQPSSGKILLNGEDLTAVPVNRRPINMMFQSYALFPHMTVAQNIAFGLKQEHRPKAEIANQVERMLTLVQLRPFASRKPHQLSGGQRQRVALARSLAKQPKILLLDEPLAALDKKLREETQFELMGIQEELGITFVIVTHDQDEAMTVASRIGVMNRGSLQQVATPGEIYEYPQSRFVADFIGSVNLLPVTLTGTAASETGERLQLTSEGLNAPLFSRPETAAFTAPGKSGWLAVRPEKITIHRERPSDAVNLVQGKVIDIAYTGNTSTYVAELENGQSVRAQQTNANLLSRREITWDDQVWLSWRAASGVLLDR